MTGVLSAANEQAMLSLWYDHVAQPVDASSVLQHPCIAPDAPCDLYSRQGCTLISMCNAAEAAQSGHARQDSCSPSMYLYYPASLSPAPLQPDPQASGLPDPAKIVRRAHRLLHACRLWSCSWRRRSSMQTSSRQSRAHASGIRCAACFPSMHASARLSAGLIT